MDFGMLDSQVSEEVGGFFDVEFGGYEEDVVGF